MPTSAHTQPSCDLTDEQLSVVGTYATAFFNRSWFADLDLGSSTRVLTELILGIFVSFERGSLATKKQAMAFMNTVDARTAHRYLSAAEEKGLITITQSSVDRRVSLLCPTPLLLELVRKELVKVAHELRSALTAIEVVGRPSAETPWYLQGEHFSNPYLTTLGGIERLLADQQEEFVEGRSYPGHLEHERTIARLSEVLRLAPHNREARRQRADEYAFACKADEAIADYSFLIDLDPANPEYFAGRARAHVCKDAFDDGLADFERALLLAADRYDILKERAEVFMEVENFPAAVNDLDRAIPQLEQIVHVAPAGPHRFRRKLIDAYFMRAKSLQRIGDMQNAMSDLQKILGLEPDMPAAAEKLAALRALTEHPL